MAAVGKQPACTLVFDYFLGLPYCIHNGDWKEQLRSSWGFGSIIQLRLCVCEQIFLCNKNINKNDKKVVIVL